MSYPKHDKITPELVMYVINEVKDTAMENAMAPIDKIITRAVSATTVLYLTSLHEPQEDSNQSLIMKIGLTACKDRLTERKLTESDVNSVIEELRQQTALDKSLKRESCFLGEAMIQLLQSEFGRCYAMLMMYRTIEKNLKLTGELIDLVKEGKMTEGKLADTIRHEMIETEYSFREELSELLDEQIQKYARELGYTEEFFLPDKYIKTYYKEHR